MRRSTRIPLVLSSLFLVGVLAPGAVAARSPDREIVTFVSREELIAAGLIVPSGDAETASKGGRTAAVQPQALCVWDCIYVKNRRYLRTVKPFVTMVQGNGPTTIAIDISRTVRNSFSANVSVSAEIVTAGVGFNVERSETVAYKSSTVVPNGACWTIRAYNVFFEYGFEVWQEPFIGADKKIGSGTARDFQGIEFRLSKWC